jgi:Rrf2 family protein
MNNLFNLSEAGYIAFHALLMLSQEENKVINVREIANKTRASEFHISKVMQMLVKNNFISSTRGPQGGFKLIADPKKTYLSHIFELTEGKISNCNCPFGKQLCEFDRCPFDGFINKLGDEFIKYLTTRTLYEFINTEA